MPFEKSSNRNGLAGDNKIYSKIDGNYDILSLDDLFDLFKANTIEVPSIDSKGNQIWVRVTNIIFIGKRKSLKVIPTNGLYFTTIGTQKTPTIITAIKLKQTSDMNLRFIEIKEIKKLDKFWFLSHFENNLKEGETSDYKNGFFVGFFLAEGNYIYYSHKLKQNSKFSNYALKRWSLEKGYSKIEDYLFQRKDKRIKGLQLSCGYKDLKKGYLDKIVFSKNINRYGKKVHVSIYDKNAISIIKRYVHGSTSKNKRLKQLAFNKSKSFLQGVLDGFIAGDGYIAKTRISIGMTNNYILRDQLMIISKMLKFEPRFSESKINLKNYKKTYQILILRLCPLEKRFIRNNIFFQNLRRIDKYETQRIYRIELESRAALTDEWNRLLVLGNGCIVQV